MGDTSPNLPKPIGRLLCWLGIHEFRLLEVNIGLGKGNTIEKVECRRCGFATSRRR